MRVRLRLASALALMLAGLAVAPSAADAHAVLEGTEPAAGDTLRGQPEQLVFRFSEPVEGSFGAIRVFDTGARRVESGEAFHPQGRGSSLGVRLAPDLAQGSYTATYRVISADGHPVSGGMVFSIGKASATAGSVSELLADQGETGSLTQVGFGAARGVQYAAIAIALGAFFFLLAVWSPALAAVAGPSGGWRGASEQFVSRLRRLAFAAAGAGAVSGALGIVFQGATAAGTSFWSALRPEIWSEVLDTRFGTVWGLRSLVWLALVPLVLAVLGPRWRPALRPASLGPTGLALPERPPPALLATLAVPLSFLALSPALSGHASLQEPVALLFPANVIHVLAVSVWVGGLALLVLALPAATRQLPEVDRTRLLAATLTRFSMIAGVAVLALLAGGVAQAIAEVGTLESLTETAFGRAVLVKVCLFAGLLALGAYNRRRMVPELRSLASDGERPGRAGVVVRRALSAEVGLAVAVRGVTAALVSYAPSVAVSSGPVSARESLGPADLQLTVDPARVGPNEMHVFLTNRRDGSQFDLAKEFSVELTEPEEGIGPISQSARKAGPGHYVMDGAGFGVAGDWEVRVAARVSKFDAYYATLEVPIR